MKKETKRELITLLEMHKKDILIIVLVILCAVGSICAIYFPNSNINNVIGETQNIILQEIVVSKETEELAIQTKEAVENGKSVETTETIKSTVEEEQNLEEEQLEPDALVEQENISYNGDITGNGLDLLGKTTKLTYYSQADRRWRF